MKKIIKKIPGHPRHHALLAIILATLAVSAAIAIRSFAQASDLPMTTKSIKTTHCKFETGDWSKCDSTGHQTRTVTNVPSGCVVTNSSQVPLTTQTCTYTNPTSCVYSYGDWSDCSSSGHQTRKVIARNPNGCAETTSPVTKQTCTITKKAVITPTPCSYTYSAWGECGSDRYQIRKIASKSPNGCVDSAAPILKQSCTYSPATDNASTIACAYNLSDWSTCNSSGKQTRSIISKTPAGCYESEKPSLEGQCEYTEEKTKKVSTETASTETKKSTSINPTFNFLNLNGGEVISGEIVLQGTVSNADAVEFYLIPIESNSPKYLGQARRKEQNTWEYNLDSKKQPNGSFFIRVRIKNAYGVYDSEQRRLIILNSTQETRNVADNSREETVVNKTQNSAIPKISDDWQEKHFKEAACVDEEICGGEADPDGDGLNNNEEYRLGSSPINPDTDQDGFLDGDEIKNGFNPLKASPGDKSDKMVFESPKEIGEIKKELYKINNVEMVSHENENKNLKISGQALPNTYITIYIYSDPIVLTVKTDADGNWSYILDKNLEDGEHEVYVAVTDNTGKITAKSEPLAFVKTAEAATIIPPLEASANERAISPTGVLSKKISYFFVIAISLSMLALILATLGLIKHEMLKKTENGD